MANASQTVDSPWLRVKEAARYSKRSESLLLNALRAGDIPGSQTKRGGTWLVHRDDLDAWLRGERAEVKVPAVSRPRRAS